jgi:DNA repair protein RecO (recombination protein O)
VKCALEQVVHITSPAIVVAVLPHGEHGAVVRFLTPDAGLVAGYVNGGRSRTMRPVLHVGNGVHVDLQHRASRQLATATVELVRSRALLALDADTALGLEWLTVLTASVLGEDVPCPRVHAALDGLLEAMMLDATPARWLASVARYELLLLAELGFGLDLESCAATGVTEDLVYISPRSSQAVSHGAGEPYAAKLLPLPPLLRGKAVADPDWNDVADALRATGYFLVRDLLTGRLTALHPARARLADIAVRRRDAAKSAARP